MMAKQSICGAAKYAAVATLGVIAGYGIKTVSSKTTPDTEIGESRYELKVSPAGITPSGSVTNPGEAGGEDSGAQKDSVAKLSRSERAALAMDWMFGANAASAEHQGLMHQVMLNWARKDPAGASAWLSENMHHPGLDGFIQGLVDVLVETDPEAALRWAGECKSEDEQLRASIKGVGALFNKNPDEAERLLADSGLSLEAQKLATSELIENVRASSQRNAQNLVGIMGAAVAAGATFDTSSIESVIEQLTNGVNGAGDFEDSLFKISEMDELQEDLAKSFVVIQDDGTLSYDPTGGSH